MIRATLILLIAGTAQATDWSGYGRTDWSGNTPAAAPTLLAYRQLGGEVQAPDVPPPPLPDPAQAIDRLAPPARTPQRDEPSCAAPVRQPVEPTCGYAAVAAPQCVQAVQCVRPAAECVQTVRVPVRVVRVPVAVQQCEAVECAAPAAVAAPRCALRQRGRLLGRHCARHAGAAVGYAATECAVAAPVCGGG